MSSAEARQIAGANPLSFLHVSKPEIDLPPAIDPYDAKVYAKGKENFAKLIADCALKQDPLPSFYLYRQVMGQHSQLGLVAANHWDRLRGLRSVGWQQVSPIPSFLRVWQNLLLFSYP